MSVGSTMSSIADAIEGAAKDGFDEVKDALEGALDTLAKTAVAQAEALLEKALAGGDNSAIVAAISALIDAHKSGS